MAACIKYKVENAYELGGDQIISARMVADGSAAGRYSILHQVFYYRVSDRTAFFSVLVNPESDTRTGVLVEYDTTEKIFGDPEDSRTKAYVTGRVG